MPHLVDGIAVGSFAAIALILWWPMTMDRLRHWQNRRAAKRQAPPHPNALAQQGELGPTAAPRAGRPDLSIFGAVDRGQITRWLPGT
jgi:hypothetical protein